MARRGRLVLDGGAYCGEGGFFAQLAAMHACGPYVIENVGIESTLVYTNNQPSGSIRAPTAPQVCWAVEQHMDELAEALGLDPVELRRRTLIAEGDEGPTRQVFGPIAMKETLERAVEMIAPDGDLPEDEAIGVSCGWWPSFGNPSGAYVKLNGDGSGTIVTGAQENGSGAVMALPLLVADVLGMKPSDFSILYQDTDAAPFDAGSSGSQTTMNNGRAVVAAAGEVRDKLLDLAAEQLEVAREDLELADGQVRVVGSPSKAVEISELAGSGEQLIGKGSGPVPENPPCHVEGCLGRLGMESFLEPQVFTHAARVKVDRETGVVRVLQVAAVHDSGVIVNRLGATGQVFGGVVMGIGQALLEASQLDADGRQRNPHLLDYKLVTASDAPRIDVAWIETPAQERRPEGDEGRRRAADRADSGRDRKRHRPRPRRPRQGAADDARAGLGGGRTERMTSTFVSAATVDEALSALAGGARPVAGGTDLVVGSRQGKAPLPESIVAIHRLDELRASATADGWLRLGALVTHAEIAADPLVRERLTALADASAIVGSHATRAQGTIGGNLMNASPAMEVGGPLMVFGATVTLRSEAGERQVPVADLVSGPRNDRRGAGRAAHRGRGPASPRRKRQLLRPPRVPAADGDRGRRRDGGGHGRGRVGGASRRRDHGARPHDQARAGSGGGARRLRRGRRRRRAGCGGGGQGGRADLRRPRVGRLPAGDGGGGRAACADGGGRPRAGRTVPVPASDALFGAGGGS